MSDLISRQDAINVADAVWSVTGDKNVAKVWDQIKDLPSAEPKQRWIPFKTRPLTKEEKEEHPECDGIARDALIEQLEAMDTYRDRLEYRIEKGWY